MGIYSMNWQAIGAIGEVLGGLAVFISLSYLAMQIRSSRRSDQIVVAADAASAVDQWLGQVVRDENLYVLYRRGLIDYNSLSREEKGRFALLILQYLRRLEAVWFHHEAGTISASYWKSLVAALELSLSAEGGAHSFKKYAGTLTPEFADFVNNLLSEIEMSARSVDTEYADDVDADTSTTS